MAAIKTYLSVNNVEINSIEDFVKTLQDNNQKGSYIEILEPVLGKFRKWRLKGNIKSFEGYGEPFNGIARGRYNITVDEYLEFEDMVHTDIHRETMIGHEFYNYSWGMNKDGEINMGVYWKV